ncbi:hypothetical protein BS47DRAFT_1368425 [Hydnum rufescens UP504]|uniref:Uncharacterized protein n=1 Tax=Hydnum rufescens UP504 TaxID=1448309 RepID=A0A9P6AGK3_9AGAM|nr:hypothetical protein BS47DRAFT_1368425 [Hydnum rufescens UP504]
MHRTLYEESNAKKPDDGCTWVYGNSSMTTLQKHLEAYHTEEYCEACRMHNWEISIELIWKTHEQEKAHMNSQIMKEVFTKDGFVGWLISWITADDQGHTEVYSSVIFKKWLEEFNRLRKDLAGSLGKISFTVDIWSDS